MLNKIMVEFTRNCPVCGFSMGELLYSLHSRFFDGFSIPKKRDIVSCGACGFHFADAAYSRAILSDYYKKYFTVVRSTEGETQIILQGIHFERVVNKIRTYLLREPLSEYRVCDIGCGRGAFLSAFYSQGFRNLTGVDYCDLSDEEVRQFNFRYICSDICDLDLTEKQDVIVCSHVFEHLLEVKPAVDSLYSNLKPGGIVYIEVPDFDEIRLEDTILNTGIIEHTNRFSHFQLGKILTEAGFCVRDIFNLTIGENISSLRCLCVIAEKTDAPSKVLLPKPLFSNQALALVGKFNFRIDWELAEFVGTSRPVYVWGISYYTFEIIARTLLDKCNIVALIDSSPIRQKETVNGMPISSPACIRHADADSAIVLCMANGSDEVAMHLKESGYKGTIMRFPYHPAKSVLL